MPRVAALPAARQLQLLASLLSSAVALPSCQPRSAAPWIPTYHLMGPVTADPNGHLVTGPLNDANGLAFSGGFYHVFTQVSFQWAHFRSADLQTWERLPIALGLPAWDGALSMLPAEDGGAVIVYDLCPEPSNVALARPKKISDPALIEWDIYLGNASIAIDRSDFEPSIQPPNSPTCCGVTSCGKLGPPSDPSWCKVVRSNGCQATFFPGSIWKDLNGNFNFLAQTLLNNKTNEHGWWDRLGRYVAKDKSLRSWKLVDPSFASLPDGTPVVETGGGWFLPVPGSGLTPGQTGRYLLNSGGGDEFVLGDFNGHTNQFTNLSVVQHTDFARFSTDWTAVGIANGRMLQTGWLQEAGRLCPGGCAEPQEPLLSLVRELSYDKSTDTLRVLPVVELAGLRNGTLGSVATQELNGVLTLVEAAGDGGSTADIQMSFTFQPDIAPIKFGVGVFCPPRFAGIEALVNCTQVWFEVHPAGVDGVRTATMSVRTAPDQFNHTAYNFTSAPFAVPMSATTINLRVLTDRAVVEAYAGVCGGHTACGKTAGTFDAIGQVAVEALAFPAMEATGVELFAVGATVGVDARAWGMGCGWVGGN